MLLTTDGLQVVYLWLTVDFAAHARSSCRASRPRQSALASQNSDSFSPTEILFAPVSHQSHSFTQGARPDDGKRYAIMAKKQLAGAQSRGATPRDPQPFSAAAAAGGAGPPVDIRVQERVRAILMLTVLYDMLGQYDESDKYLADALNVRTDSHILSDSCVPYTSSRRCAGKERGCER